LTDALYYRALLEPVRIKLVDGWEEGKKNLRRGIDRKKRKIYERRIQ